MVRIAHASSALLIAASALSVSDGLLQYNVRVRNLTYQQPFSPVTLAIHTKELSLFKEGLAANLGVKLIAETGDLSALVEEILAQDQVASDLCGFAIGEEVIMPGGEGRYSLIVDEEFCGDNPRFTLASMLVNTNDAFVGVGDLAISYYSSSKVYPPAFDAGTEENNELCTHMPGPVCDATSGNEEAGPGEGYIHIHRGIHGNGDLSAAAYDWNNPVAEIYIAKPTHV